MPGRSAYEPEYAKVRCRTTRQRHSREAHQRGPTVNRQGRPPPISTLQVMNRFFPRAKGATDPEQGCSIPPTGFEPTWKGRSIRHEATSLLVVKQAWQQRGLRSRITVQRPVSHRVFRTIRTDIDRSPGACLCILSSSSSQVGGEHGQNRWNGQTQCPATFNRIPERDFGQGSPLGPRHSSIS